MILQLSEEDFNGLVLLMGYAIGAAYNKDPEISRGFARIAEAVRLSAVQTVVPPPADPPAG